MDLTPEQEAAIIDIAERYMARRARGVKTGAAVSRNNWTPLEAAISGARNDLRSVEIRLRKARDAGRLEEVERLERSRDQKHARLAELVRDL